MRIKRTIIILAITALFILAIPAAASANSMYLGSSAHPPRPQNSTDIVLEKQVMQIWLRKGFAEVENVYQLYNAGEGQEFVMGLPEEVNTKAALSYGVYNFDAFIDGKSVETRTVRTKDQKAGKLVGNINWHTHNIFIPENQRRIVVHRYWVLINPWKNELVIPLAPGASWKGRIGEAYYVVHLMGSLTEKNIVYPAGYGDFTGKYAVLPTGFKPGKDKIVWSLLNHEPSRDLEIKMFSFKEDDIDKTVVKASGIYVNDDKEHPPNLVIDEDASTAWAVGGEGKKEWLTFTFPKKKWVREFRITPGYGALGAMYKYYNRPQKVTLRFSNGKSQSFMLDDSLEMQYFPVKPIQTKSVKLEIDSVYKGIYPDVTYISEVEFGDIKTSSKVSPIKWKVGLNQVEVFNLRPRYSSTDRILIAVTVAVFFFIAWQVVVAIRSRLRAKKN